MPLTLNVGLSRKVGEANYGSRGGNVNLELEVESALVAEPAKLKERIRTLFTLIRAALAEELSGSHPLTHGARPPPEANGRPPSPPRPATPAQVSAIYAIARRTNVDLGELLQGRFQVPRPEDLSVPEASQVIDHLKAAIAEQEG